MEHSNKSTHNNINTHNQNLVYYAARHDTDGRDIVGHNCRDIVGHDILGHNSGDAIHHNFHNNKNNLNNRYSNAYHMSIVSECKVLMDLVVNHSSQGIYLPISLVTRLHRTLRSLVAYGVNASVTAVSSHSSETGSVLSNVNSVSSVSIDNNNNNNLLPTVTPAILPPAIASITTDPITKSETAASSLTSLTPENVNAPNINGFPAPIVAWRAPHLSVQQTSTRQQTKPSKFMDSITYQRACVTRDRLRMMQACDHQTQCEIPDCPRVHGTFEPLQDEYFRQLRQRGDSRCGFIVCRYHFWGKPCVHSGCTYRHFVPGSIRQLSKEQLEILKNV